MCKAVSNNSLKYHYEFRLLAPTRFFEFCCHRWIKKAKRNSSSVCDISTFVREHFRRVRICVNQFWLEATNNNRKKWKKLPRKCFGNRFTVIELIWGDLVCECEWHVGCLSRKSNNRNRNAYQNEIRRFVEHHSAMNNGWLTFSYTFFVANKRAPAII